MKSYPDDRIAALMPIALRISKQSGIAFRVIRFDTKTDITGEALTALRRSTHQREMDAERWRREVEMNCVRVSGSKGYGSK